MGETGSAPREHISARSPAANLCSEMTRQLLEKSVVDMLHGSKRRTFHANARELCSLLKEWEMSGEHNNSSFIDTLIHALVYLDGHICSFL